MCANLAWPTIGAQDLRMTSPHGDRDNTCLQALPCSAPTLCHGGVGGVANRQDDQALGQGAIRKCHRCRQGGQVTDRWTPTANRHGRGWRRPHSQLETVLRSSSPKRSITGHYLLAQHQKTLGTHEPIVCSGGNELGAPCRPPANRGMTGTGTKDQGSPPNCSKVTIHC